MALYVDPSWLIDEFIYYEYTGEDRNHIPTYKEPVIVKKCRVSYKPVFSIDKSEKNIVANGKIYCFASDTTPFIEYKEQSKIVLYGCEMVLTACQPFKEPEANVLWSYELEVL